MSPFDYIKCYSGGGSAACRNRGHRPRRAPRQDRPRRGMKGDSHVVRHLDLTRSRPPWQASRTSSPRRWRDPVTGAYPAEHSDEPPAGLNSCAETRTGPAGGDPARPAPAARAATAAACGVPARNNQARVSCRIASGTGADPLSGTTGTLRQPSGRPAQATRPRRPARLSASAGPARRAPGAPGRRLVALRSFLRFRTRGKWLQGDIRATALSGRTPLSTCLSEGPTSRWRMVNQEGRARLRPTSQERS